MGIMHSLRLSFFLLVAVCASAQSFTFGLKGGFPLTYSESSQTGVNFTIDSSSRRFIIGGTAELGLPFGISVEGDVLYHPYNLRDSRFGVTNYTLFEIPVLAKLRIGNGLARPYVDAGPEFRTSPSDLSLSHDGFVIGGGIEFRLLLLRISPEVRYTRWASSSVEGSNPNQAAVLLGVTF